VTDPDFALTLVDPEPAKTGAMLNRFRSDQEVQTDPSFIEAVVRRFGPISFDLAASPENAQAPKYFTREQNALAQDWTQLEGTLWLNCEFGSCDVWSRKCANSAAAPHRFQRILLLTPAAIGTEWFAQNVHRKAFVLALRGRLTFVGQVDPFPKCLMLSVYGDGLSGLDVWDWTGRHADDYTRAQKRLFDL